MKEQTPIIGVVGGMGPYAGLDLIQKIFDQTAATKDQEHLPVILISNPHVPDRTEFLLQGGKENPAYAIVQSLHQLASLGAVAAGIPCNTAHAPAIFDVVLSELKNKMSSLRVVNMISEVADYVAANFRGFKHIGVLSTTGTLRTRLYSTVLESKGFSVVEPEDRTQEKYVQDAIYNPTYGIKARSNPVTEEARNQIIQAIRILARDGAEAIVWGCTEIPLALDAPVVEGLRTINPTLILARALIRETSPEKLRSLV